MYIIAGYLSMEDVEKPFSSQAASSSKDSLHLVTAFRFGRSSQLDAQASTELVLDSEPTIQHSTSEHQVWAVRGEDIRLSCSISNLGNRTVSWVRYRDIHLLTAGKDSYTDDKRFSAHHPIMTNNWQLRIKNVTHRFVCMLLLLPDQIVCVYCHHTVRVAIPQKM